MNLKQKASILTSNSLSNTVSHTICLKEKLMPSLIFNMISNTDHISQTKILKKQLKLFLNQWG